MRRTISLQHDRVSTEIACTLPNSAHLRTAAYVDDHAQGTHTFADFLQGYTDFLALCERENWTLNATKPHVGFPSCVFFGFHVDKAGTRLADKTLDPIKRMVPLTNLPELRTLGVFVQSSRFIPRYAHVVRPLTELTRCEKGLGRIQKVRDGCADAAKIRWVRAGIN
jgi:hypothetical protein